jgi:hypothetical protein
MRKRNYVIGAVALLAIAVAIPSIAQSAITSQTIKSVVTPSKLSKSRKTPTPATIRVDVDAAWDHYGPTTSPAAVNTDVDFDKALIFNTKPVKTCPASKLTGVTTEQAIAACGSAKVGSGTARLDGVVGPLNAVVTAFNGAPVGGKPQILLHTRLPQPLPITQVLVGTLDKSPAGAPYGSRLHVPIPAVQIGGGAEVITHFDTTVSKKFKITKKINGKKVRVKSGYVTAICPKAKKIKVQGVFGYGTKPTFAQSSSTTAKAPDQPCKQKQ